MTKTFEGIKVRTRTQSRYVAVRVARRFDGVRYDGVASVEIFKRSADPAKLRTLIQRPGFHSPAPPPSQAPPARTTPRLRRQRQCTDSRSRAAAGRHVVGMGARHHRDGSRHGASRRLLSSTGR
jgi:hypothetical protein